MIGDRIEIEIFFLKVCVSLSPLPAVMRGDEISGSDRTVDIIVNRVKKKNELAYVLSVERIERRVEDKQPSKLPAGVRRRDGDFEKRLTDTRVGDYVMFFFLTHPIKICRVSSRLLSFDWCLLTS